MRILRRNLRAGELKIEVDSFDDLWYLSNIIVPGDLVRSKTERRIKGKEDIERSKSERVTITVTIKVEKTDFKLESDSFRITGTIEQGPEDLVSIGTYHTINVEKGTVLTLIKERWSGFDLDRLKDAEKSSLRPKLLIAVIDDGDACIGLVRESKIEYYELSKIIGGKYDIKGRQDRRMEYYKESAELLNNLLGRENVSALIVAGAGFEKEGFHRFLSEKYPQLYGISVVENIGSSGRCGVSEVMKRSKARKVTEEVNAAREIRLLEEILAEVGKDSGLAAYGPGDVESAVNMGAVQKLILCDDHFIRNRKKAENLMQNVKSSGGEIHIINREGDAGRQLSSIGGIAAILRYRIN